jgi:hypothetical protein
MFAPAPLKDDGWYVIPGQLRSGVAMDVFQTMYDFTQLLPVRWEKPAAVAQTYKNQRWRKYMMNLWLKQNSAHRLYFGRYLCREWNRRHAVPEQLVEFQIYFMMEYTQPDFQPSLPQKTLLWSHQCFP